MLASPDMPKDVTRFKVVRFKAVLKPTRLRALLFYLLVSSLVLQADGLQTSPAPASSSAPQSGAAVHNGSPAPIGGAAVAASPMTNAVADTTPVKSVPRLIFSSVAYCGSDPEHKHPCRLGDTLFVGFSNLQQWMSVSTNHVTDIVLVLNGRVMKGLTCRGPDDTYSGLQFDLRRLDGNEPDEQDNRATWNILIPQLRDSGMLHVAVASGGAPPFWGSADVPFQVFPWYTWAVLAFLLLLLVGFILVARQSDIVRDAPSVPGQPQQSYSLARCQMAWWFFIIASSFCYIWLTLSNHDSLTAGVLILSGISAGTGLASAVIDGNKDEQRRSLEVEQVAITAHLAALPARIAAADETDAATLHAEQIQKTARLAAVQASLEALPEIAGPTEGFLRDILRDGSGISFHRFQMASWTVILGFVFVTSVYSNLTMPDFSATLLGLMGISSGTYIGFKIPDPPK